MAHPVEVSGREAEVLAAVGAHLSNAQIAGRLHLSVRTVEGHVSTLLRKYGVADRRELAALVGPDAGPAPPPGGIAGLPAARTSFVGRAAEQAAVLAALAEHRLVTLSGPGGVGKTRLAVVVAGSATFPFGGAFVDLVPARDDSVPQAVAAALGVAEGPQQPLEAAIGGRLARGRSLLVLDNCEHVVDAVAGFVERLLAACPTVTVLATSRERLAVPGERVVAVGPLPLGSDAERLFADRAPEPIDPGAVADLCARLDGLPLAIELAAARSAALGGPGLLTGLGDYLRLLTGGRGTEVRHRSLRTVIGWSHDLLDGEERSLFRRLAVFAGGFDLPAAAAVGGVEPPVAADVLGRLVDKSLVVHAHGRWRLLATIRAVAADKLRESGEAAEVQDRYRMWAVEKAAALVEPSRAEVDLVLDDLRDALSSYPPGPDPAAHRLARSLGRITHARGFLQEARRRYEQAAAHAGAPDEQARDLRSAAECAEVGHDTGLAFDLLVAAGRVAVDGNLKATALALAVDLACRCPATFAVEVPYERLCALLAEAADAGDGADPVAATRLAIARAWNAGPRKLWPDRALAEAAVAAARRTGDSLPLSAALGALRGAAVVGGDLQEAHRLSTERLALVPAFDPTEPEGAAEIEDVLAVACADAVAVGEIAAAADVARRILDADLHGDSPHLSVSTVLPALVLAGDLGWARREAPAMWEGWERAGRPPAVWLPVAAQFAALAWGLSGDEEQAALWNARAAEAGGANVFHLQHAPLGVFTAARTAVHLGRAAEVPEPTSGRYHAYAVAAHAELAVVAGRPDAAERLAAAESGSAGHAWAAACLARATGRLHGDHDALEAAVAGFERIGARLEWAATLLLLPGRAAGGRAQLTALGVSRPG
ncbi:LuxR C-terminal-related transcriptional regulator [Pseudonocardia sp. DSM 110487]|uniref:ATP-binding protein n=1 Tax=Pseudonocardia sp. DSM 110487 TaxID=2865833 RepID=UPI001C694428|nr:LuxR C-terminal-related transcriptional regulator [Pseudonocardia sp. DSM 110487]QYN34463.1 LuxR C-terminal-related transcriptional regulator [Pseudonocardia sp. DSM 110487]